MRRSKLAAALVGIGTAAALVLPVTGAFADPGRGHVTVTQVRYGDRDGWGGDRGRWGDDRDRGYGRWGGDRGYGRWRGEGRWGGDHDWHRDRDWGWGHRGRYYGRGGGDDLGWFLGGAVLGAIIGSQR